MTTPSSPLAQALCDEQYDDRRHIHIAAVAADWRRITPGARLSESREEQIMTTLLQTLPWALEKAPDNTNLDERLSDLLIQCGVADGIPERRRLLVSALESINRARESNGDCEIEAQHPACIVFRSVAAIDVESVFETGYRRSVFMKILDIPGRGIAAIIDPVMDLLQNARPVESKAKEQYVYEQLSRRPMEGGPTPFLQAVITSNPIAVEAMLKCCPRLADDPVVLSTVLRRDGVGYQSILQVLLRFRRGLLTSENLRLAIRMSRDSQKVQLFCRPRLFDVEVAQLLIQEDHCQQWLQNAPSIFEAFENYLDSGLLHLAVKYRKLEFVRHLINRGANVGKLCSVDENGPNYPLWFINNGNSRYRRLNGAPVSDDLAPESPHQRGRDTDPDGREIRRILINQMIRDYELTAIEDIIEASDDLVENITFNLGDSYASSTQFIKLIDFFTSELSAPQTFTQNLNFEPVLRHVNFPQLYSIFPDVRRQYKDVDKILHWLRWEKNVEEVIELVVRDRLWGAHDEKTISHWLGFLRVKDADWRRLDLSMVYFEDDVMERLRSLRLYSSGLAAVHDHWFGPRGLRRLHNLTNVTICVVKDVMTKRQAHEAVKDLQKKAMKLEDQLDGKMKVLIDCDKWDEKSKSPAELRPSLVSQIRIPELSEFLGNYRTHGNERMFRRTRVAVINSGVMVPYDVTRTRDRREKASFDHHEARTADAISEEDFSEDEAQNVPIAPSTDIMEHIVGGESFVWSGNLKSSWYIAADPHGTQMVTLICAVDPLCEILVAKVADDQHSMTKERVAKAIHWAIRQEADIISISSSIDAGKMWDLATAVEEATAKGIVMLEGFRDEGEGQSITASFGSDPSIMAIAACDVNGNIPAKPHEDQYDYKLHGSGRKVGVIPFLHSSNTVSGDPVATALATGLASLTLSCLRLSTVDDLDSDGRHWKRKLIMDAFKHMAAQHSRKYVLLDRFLGLHELIGVENKEVNVKRAIENWFGENGKLRRSKPRIGSHNFAS